MPIDASIPLGVKPPTMFDPSQLLTLQNLSRQGQMQQVQLEDAQRAQQEKGMIRAALQGGTDPNTGRVSPVALSRISEINPEMGINLTRQQDQLRLQDIALNEKKTEVAKEVGTSYVTAFDRFLQQTGGNKDEAKRLATQHTLAAIDEMDRSGRLRTLGLDTQSIAGLKSLPDPETARTTVIALGGKVPDIVPTNKQERKRISGMNEIQEEWDPSTKTWREIGRGPRFAGTTDEGKAPAGYRFSKTKPGDLEPIPGGPAAPQSALSKEYSSDPDYKKSVDFWANFVKEGGTLPARFAQSGAGKKMMPDITNVIPTLGNGNSKDMLANQVDVVGQKSEARTVGTRAGNVELAAGEAREMMPILTKASEDFKRTGYQPINKVFKAYQDNTGSVESRQFGAALNTFVNVYARAVSPSGTPTVSDKDHAREVLSTADSHEQLLGLLKILDKEMVAAQNAPKRVRDSQRAGITGQPATSQEPAPGGTSSFADADKERRYQEWKAKQK